VIDATRHVGLSPLYARQFVGRLFISHNILSNKLARKGRMQYAIRTEEIFMKMREDIRPVTYLKSRAADLLDQLNKTHRPIVITQNGEARAVIQDPESYERTKTAIGFLKLLAQGEENIRSGKMYDQDEMFDRLARKLNRPKAKRAQKAKF
jgi:prevent-host-death family protein